MLHPCHRVVIDQSLQGDYREQQCRLSSLRVVIDQSLQGDYRTSPAPEFHELVVIDQSLQGDYREVYLQISFEMNRHLLRSGAEENVIKNVTVKAGT